MPHNSIIKCEQFKPCHSDTGPFPPSCPSSPCALHFWSCHLMIWHHIHTFVNALLPTVCVDVYLPTLKCVWGVMTFLMLSWVCLTKINHRQHQQTMIYVSETTTTPTTTCNNSLFVLDLDYIIDKENIYCHLANNVIVNLFMALP